jgi:hypothetical protein
MIMTKTKGTSKRSKSNKMQYPDNDHFIGWVFRFHGSEAIVIPWEYKNEKLEDIPKNDAIPKYRGVLRRRVHHKEVYQGKTVLCTNPIGNAVELWYVYKEDEVDWLAQQGYLSIHTDKGNVEFIDDLTAMANDTHTTTPIDIDAI